MVTGDHPKPSLSSQALGRIGLFGGLPEPVLAGLADALSVERVETGRIIVGEGDVARDMFVVWTGELEVTKRGKGGTEVRVAMLGPGDWFGEMAILDVQTRSASVRTVAPTDLVRLSTEHVEHLLYRRDPKAYALFVMNIARELSRRLRVADGIVAQIAANASEEYVRRLRQRHRPSG
jgi:CRP/FNR family transcriptional regulator, cyclic AMP receptor protein